MMMNLIRASTSLIVLVLMFSSQSSAKFDPKTLVGAWLFDGNAKDASENGKDGKLENGPTFVAGEIGQALKFAGGKAGNDRVNLGNLGLAPSGTATLVFWAKPAGAVLDDRMISNMNGPAVPAFSIRFAPPKVEFWGSTWQPIIPKFEDNQWGHYAFVFDDKTNVTGYYNGKKGLTVKDNFAFTDIGIGANFIGQWGQHFTGLMDEMAFFNVALTQDEVITIKENSLAEADVQGGSVAMWLFDEGTGRVAKDSSGNGNDGVLKNAPQWVEGKVGQALKFDGGKKSYVDVGNLGLKGPVTLVFWAKPAGLEERIVVQSALPALKNHLVYVAYETSVQGRIRSLIQMVEEEAIQTGTVFDENGLRIRRCIY